MMSKPKVFSIFNDKTYEELFPNIQTLGENVDFFLECMAYDVILPVESKAEKRLDIFEEAILKLMAKNFSDLDDIAEMLCLTRDLVNFITIRLSENGLLKNNRRELTEKGKEYIGVSESIQDKKNIVYEKIKIFVIEETGEILPYIHKGEFIYEEVEFPSNGNISVNIGSIGKSIYLEGKVLKKSNKNKFICNIDSSYIKKSVIKYNKIARNNEKFSMINFIKNYHIQYSYSEKVYFHMKSVIQYGNVDDLMFSDGFVQCVDSVKRYIKENFIEFIQYVKEKAVLKEVKKEELSKKEELKGKNARKYIELRKFMDEIYTHSNLYTNIDSDETAYRDENKNLEAEQKKFLNDSYAAFEWILHYYNRNPQNAMDFQIKERINNKNAKNNKDFIIKMAEKIGLKSPNKYGMLFTLDQRRMRSMFKKDVPVLAPSLSIAIITSADDYESGFRKLFENRPDLFNILLDLHKEHGEISHKTNTNEVYKERNKKIYDLLNDFIKYLIPDFEIDENLNKDIEKKCISQNRLNAEVSLAKELGYTYFYNEMQLGIRNEWIHISPDKKISEYPSLHAYAAILYRIMQDTLFYEIINIEKKQDLKKERILEKLDKKGLSSESLKTVAERHVKSILNNENSTLGAVGMVYLYYQEDKKINLLKESSFIYTIERIMDLREHGNKILLNTDIKELNKLRDNLMKISKIIGGN